MVIINTTGKQNQVWLDKPYGTVGCPDAVEAYRSGFTAGVEDQKSKLSSLSISGNGEYVSEDGFSAVTVDVPQTGHTDQEMEDSWNSGYTSGYTDGQASVDCTDFYNSGYTDGYESGYTDGYVERAAILTAMTITANGAYESVEGWSAVTVNVPQTGRTEDKEVYLSRADFPIIPPQAGGFPEGEIWIGALEHYSPSSGYIGMGTFSLDAELNVTDIYVSGHTSGVTDGVAQQKALLSATAFTTNGTYTRTDGWSAVTVNVPQTGYTQQDLDNAYASGLTNGYDSGWTVGYDSGYTDGMEECQPTTATSISVSVPRLEPGETGNTNVSITPGGAFTRLVFTSSDDSVATIDNGGSITAIGTGTTNICVEDTVSQLTSCAVLTVNNPVSGSADLTATVQAKTASQSVLISKDKNLGSVNKMAIDGVDITPVSAYTFGDTDPHTLEVWYLSGTIPYGAYEGAAQLKNVVINDRMTVIGGRAFFDCTGITSVHLGSGMTNLGNSSFQGCKSLTSVIVPDNVTSIGTHVFSTCTSLTSVTFGTGLSVIPTGTLKDCAALQSVTINGTVTELGSEAFRGCGNLNGVVLPNSLTTIGGSAFMDCGITSIQMPDNVASAGTAVFQGCTALTTVSISSGLSAITDNMFSGCSSLTGVVLPNTIKTIGESAFNACGKMTGITLSSGLTRIDDDAFRFCTYLRGIDIPATVVKIGAYSFQFDASLPVYGITVRNSVPCEIGSSAFASTDDAPIYVPAASVDTYKAASGWRNYADRIQAIQE